MEMGSLYLYVVAHNLIGFYFIFFGIWNLYHWTPILEVMVQKNIPHPYLLLPIGIFWQTVAGGLLMAGMFVKLTALCLIPFTIISVLVFHPFWKFRGEMRALNLTIFIANLTVGIAGLLLLIFPVSHMSDFFILNQWLPS